MGARLDAYDGQFVATGDPKTVDETSANQFVAGQLGHVAALLDASPSGAGLPRLWQYIFRSATDAVTVIAGMPALWKDFDDFSVTSDTSDSFDASGVNHVAGVFVGTAPASSNYGYIQVGGITKILFKITPALVPTTGGLPVIAGTDGQADTYDDWATSTTDGDRPFAKTIAVGDSSSSTSSDVILLIDRIGW